MSNYLESTEEKVQNSYRNECFRDLLSKRIILPGNTQNQFLSGRRICQLISLLPILIILSIISFDSSAQVTIASGNFQVGAVNSPLSIPLVVSIDCSQLSPGVIPQPCGTVNWTSSDSTDSFSPGNSTVTTGSTSAAQASVTLILGSSPGSRTITATSNALLASVTFSINGNGPDPLADPVRDVLDKACSATQGGAINALCNQIRQLPPDEQQAAYRQLAPAQISSQATGALQGQLVQTSNINARIVALRAGTGTLFNFDRLAIRVAGNALPASVLALVVQAQGNNGSGGSKQSPEFSRLGIFLNGQFSFGDQNASNRELSSDLRTQGVTGGIDYRFTDRLILGLAGGFMHVKTDFNRSGNLDTSGYTASIFGTYYISNKFYLDGILTYGRNGYNTRRNISFTGFDASATGRTHSNQYAASVTSGYNFHYRGFAFGPVARMNYAHVGINSFQERGGGAANLAVSNQGIESLTHNLGGQIAYAISQSWGVMLPTVRLEWEHQHANSSRLLTSTFVADPTQTFFAIPTNNPDRDYFNLATGITATFTNRATAFVNYETVVGRHNISNHIFAVGGRWEF